MSNPATSDQRGDPAAAIERVSDELESLRRELEHMHRLSTLGTMAAGVAHEINNILTPALSYAHMAKSRPDDPELQQKAIEKSITCIESATKIAQQILHYSSQPQEAPIACVEQCLNAAVDCLARKPAQDRIKLICKVHASTSVAMRPLALQQVLLNLLLNACTAMRGRGGTLRVESMERSDGTTMITVSDTGPGIDPSIADRIFQPFVTASSRDARGRRAGGSGLGLTICRRLVSEASGTIDAESLAGSGTTMTIVLPTAKAKRAVAV